MLVKQKGVLRKLYMTLILLFLYAPLVVMILFSFNSKNSTGKFGGFSLRWYGELATDTLAVDALKNTLLLAVLASAVAVVLGTLAALGIDKMRHRWLKSTVMSVTNLPMMNPEIVTGISLMLLYVFAVTAFSRLLNKSIPPPLGFTTMLLSHITFCLPYVVLSVLPKLRQCDPHLAEAAQDLGCSPAMATLKVVLPNIMTGIVSGFIMSFTLSIDDFVVSYFVSGNGFQTLPLYIYSMTKKRISPDMYALSSLLLVSIFLLLVLSNLTGKKEKKQKKMHKPPASAAELRNKTRKDHAT